MACMADRAGLRNSSHTAGSAEAASWACSSPGGPGRAGEHLARLQAGQLRRPLAIEVLATREALETLARRGSPARTARSCVAARFRISASGTPQGRSDALSAAYRSAAQRAARTHLHADERALRTRILMQLAGSRPTAAAIVNSILTFVSGRAEYAPTDR